MSDIIFTRGIERVEVDSSWVTMEILQRTFRVRCMASTQVVIGARCGLYSAQEVSAGCLLL